MFRRPGGRLIEGVASLPASRLGGLTSDGRTGAGRAQVEAPIPGSAGEPMDLDLAVWTPPISGSVGAPCSTIQDAASLRE